MTTFDTNKYNDEMMKLYKKSFGSGKAEFAGIPCPGTGCKVCSSVQEVFFNKSIPKGDPLRERARSIMAKDRYYSNVYLVSNPLDLIVFEYTDKYIGSTLVSWQMDPTSELKDFFHPKNGRNIFITKVPTGPDPKQVEYRTEPRINSTPIIDPKVLTKLVNLDNLIELVTLGDVKPFYQSKLQNSVKTELRILPSWLGPEYPFFFKRIAYHFNISPEEFKATQEGKLNPIKNVTSEVQLSTVFQQQTTSKEEDLGKWGFKEEVVASTVTAPSLEDDRPACFGEFDDTNSECKEDCATWADSCAVEYQEKLKKRKAMQRLQRK